jgi:hypothetical protein
MTVQPVVPPIAERPATLALLLASLLYLGVFLTGCDSGGGAEVTDSGKKIHTAECDALDEEVDNIVSANDSYDGLAPEEKAKVDEYATYCRK